MQIADHPKDCDNMIRILAMQGEGNRCLRHELRLHHPRHLMVILGPLPQERVNLINEDDAWLTLPREAKEPRHKLIRFPIPLVREDRCRNVDECCSRFFGEGFR